MRLSKIQLLLVGLIVIVIVGLGSYVQSTYSRFSEFSSSIGALFETNLENSAELFDFNLLFPLVETLSTINSNSLLFRLIPNEYLSIANKVSPHTQEISQVLNNLTQKDQRWLIIFQNSDEIRPTGGFMGSYSILTIQNGKLTEITTEDIYDADGQFSGFISPPAGVKEYLSSGNGLRLPDANWHPDTAVSSNQILQFFALGNKQKISGVILVNIEFAEGLLDVLGDIELIDYNTIVTSDNISEVLRTRRSDFFPGSIQKKHMLSQLLTQVRLKLLSLDPEQIPELFELVTEHLKMHSLQFYAVDTQIDESIAKHNFRQMLPEETQELYLYIVESNVGINKANKNINRSVDIEMSSNTISVLITFDNLNTPPKESKLTELLPKDFNRTLQASDSATLPESHLSYVNYQRIIVPTNWELDTITINSEEVTEFNSAIVERFEHLKEIGTLLIVPEQNSSKIEYRFFINPESNSKLTIQHQPGLPETNYSIKYNNNTIDQKIISDTEIQLHDN